MCSGGWVFAQPPHAAHAEGVSAQPALGGFSSSAGRFVYQRYTFAFNISSMAA